jgi:hypothetical protein
LKKEKTMEFTVNAKDTDYLSTISLLEDVRTRGMTGRGGRWDEEREEDLRIQRLEFDSLFDQSEDM